MSTLFPFINPEQELPTIKELPMYREVAWDFKNNSPILENGDFKIVEGNEAIKIWCYKAIHTHRYAYSIYSWDYGSEIDSLIGLGYTKSLTESEINRFIEEALLVNEYINEVIVSDVTFIDSKLSAKVKIITVYGESEVSL